MTSGGTVKVKVRDGWAVVADGEQHSGGTVLDVPADLAARWTAAGWVEPITRVPKRQRRDARGRASR